MKKIIIVLLLSAIFIVGCQKDDICIDPVTPQLIIRFYDDENPELYKKVSDLTVWADGKDTIYENIATDSIALPLDLALDFTVYNLSSSNIEDQITINYDRKEIFVSRSCGYKFIFENLNLTNVTNNWMISTEVTNQTANNETEHIKILH